MDEMAILMDKVIFKNWALDLAGAEINLPANA